MTEMNEIDFAASFRPPAPASVNAVLQRRRNTPDMAELAQAAEEKAAAEAAMQARETTAALNRMAGDPLGELTRAQQAAGIARDEVRDLEDQLERARGKLHRLAEQVVDYGHAADEVLQGSARRSGDDLLGRAKRIDAAIRVEKMLTRASSETGVTDTHRAQLQDAVRGQHRTGWLG